MESNPDNLDVPTARAIPSCVDEDNGVVVDCQINLIRDLVKAGFGFCKVDIFQMSPEFWKELELR